MSQSDSESLGLPYSPPLAFVLGMLPAMLVNNIRPLVLFPMELAEVRVALKGFLAIAGIVLLCGGIGMFILGKTTFYPARSEAKLLTNGFYRFSRNPIYLAFTLIYLAITFDKNTLWPLIFLPLVLWFFTRTIIRREEEYLEEVFGEAYREYHGRVRRWL